MQPKFLRQSFRLSALAFGVSALAACGGGGSSGGGGPAPATPAPPATEEESTLNPGTPLPPVNETALVGSLDEAIASYGPLKRQAIANDATTACNPSAFYIVSERKLQVGFKQGNGLTEAEQIRLAKLAGLALDTTLTNYGFSGSEAELQNSDTLPYYMCIKAENTALNTSALFAEMRFFDQDDSFYRQAKDQFANSFVERLRSTADNYDEVYFWFDEGLSNFAGDNLLIGSPVTWIDTIALAGFPRPMDVERLPNADAGLPETSGSNFFKLYPFYATTVAFMLSDTGLQLSRENLAQWLKTGVELDNFASAFNQLGLGASAPGGAINYSQFKANHVSLIDTWLQSETETTALTDLTTADSALASSPVTEVKIQRKPDWQSAPIAGYNLPGVAGASISFDSLTYTLDDDSYPLFFRTETTCYGNLEIQVTNGKAATTLSAATATAIDCASFPL